PAGRRAPAGAQRPRGGAGVERRHRLPPPGGAGWDRPVVRDPGRPSGRSAGRGRRARAGAAPGVRAGRPGAGGAGRRRGRPAGAVRPGRGVAGGERAPGRPAGAAPGAGGPGRAGPGPDDAARGPRGPPRAPAAPDRAPVTAAAIRRLPDALVNKIAAGEVVERPASVVKELVENSLDAGARRVEVALRGAGRQLIAVTDDGTGMAPEDCRLALERHATSKLASESELEGIGTLGFRGEALPAIFAVARLSLFSRPAAAPRGFLVRGEGGVVAHAEPADGPVGTAIEARDLFFNTPARAKFLKSPATEQAAIVRVVTQLALAHPAVHLRLVANGRPLVSAPGAATLRERVGALYGFGLASRLVDVAAEGGGARLGGVIAPPALARTHRDDIHLVVNGRVVRDTLLTQALVEAYRPLLPRDQ